MDDTDEPDAQHTLHVSHTPMQRTEASLIGRRSEAMAMVYLTTRPEIEVFVVGAMEAVDLLARINRPDTGPGAVIGVIVKGTSTPLPIPKAADTYLGRLFKQYEDGPPVSMPLLILTFSMRNDAGYVTWMVEPSSRGDIPKLIIHKHPRNVPATKDVLDEILEKVNDWSDKVQKSMFITR